MNSGLFAPGSRLYFLTIFSRKYRPPVIIFVMRWRRGWIAVSKETSTSETICWNTKFYPKIRWFKGMQYFFSSKVMLQIEEPRSEEWFLCGYRLPKLETVQIFCEKFIRNQLAVDIIQFNIKEKLVFHFSSCFFIFNSDKWIFFCSQVNVLAFHAFLPLPVFPSLYLTVTSSSQRRVMSFCWSSDSS